jgi:hypothetical protein
MKIKILIFLIILSFVASCIISCKNKADKDVDEFYTTKGEWDAGRIPFLKPYEAINATKESGWSMNLEGKDLDTGFPNIKKANVVNGIILLYSTNTILHGIDVKQSWHVIIPGKHIEKGFASHQEYFDYLKKIGIRIEPHLYDIYPSSACVSPFLLRSSFMRVPILIFPLIL